MTEPADPPALRRARVLLLSAPWIEAEACAVPVRSWRPGNPLLGAHAQLAAFVAAMDAAQPRDTGAGPRRPAPRMLVLPAPELFHAPASLAALSRIAGMAVSEGGLHLRFGPVAASRLLKGVPTLAVLADRPAMPPLPLGEHPFAAVRLPAGVAAALLYAAPAALAPPRRFDRRLPDGAPLPCEPLPARFVTADLPREGDPDAGGLLIAPLVPSAASPADPVPPAEPVPGLDPAFLAARAAPGAAPVLLPWNLAHPGSAVPDLLRKLVRLGAGQPGGCVPVLLPFNEGPDAPALLAGLAQAWRDASPDPARAGAFVARLADIAAVGALRGQVLFAWLDGGDPEHDWTLRRLEALGLACVTLRPPGMASTGPDVMADERLTIRVRDAAGPRLYRMAAVTARRLPALMAITRRAAPGAGFAAPAGPAASAEPAASPDRLA